MARPLHAQSFAPNERFVGMLSDGTRINADSIKDWHDENARPHFAGRAIFDQNNPVRWIIDQSVALGERPKAYVEIFGGDCLPCRVIDYQRSEKWTYEVLGEYLIVEPLIEVDFPGRATTPFLRIATNWLKRVVFDEKAGIPSQWHPGTVFLHDGSRISYRVVRWSTSGLSLLTESGVRKLLFSQVAELHLPRRDEWETYFEQLAVLTPDLTSRLVQAETSSGLQITVSRDRLIAKHSGDANKSENWYPLLHPAWSLDPITVPFRTVRTWRFFSVDQPPMTIFEPTGTRTDPVFSTGWEPVTNLSVQSTALRNNRQFCGWGFGVHAPTSLAFPLHSVVRQLRTRTGLDQVVGAGGCARAEIAIQSKQTQPFFRSEVFIGNQKSADTGWKNISVAAGKSEHVVLTADPVLAKRPKGADPFDVKDCLDWIEPEWKLDKTKLAQEVSQRGPSQLAALDGWNVSSHLYSQVSETSSTEASPDDSDKIPLQVRNTWDKSVPEDERSRLLIKPTGAFATFTQIRQIEGQHRWLVVCLSKPEESTDQASVIARINGRAMLEAEIPVRTSKQEPDPILIPVSEFQGRQATIEIILLASGEKSFVDWRGVALTERPPGIAPLFDESDEIIQHLQAGEGELSRSTVEPKHGDWSLKLEAGDRSSAEIPGINFPIREHPRLGEYRYLRFSWRKKSGGQIGFQLGHDLMIGVPENEFGRVKPRAFAEGIAAVLKRQRNSPRRPVSGSARGIQFGYQYDAGSGDPVQPVLRLDRKLPTDWRMMGRDLFGEFGSFTLTGLGFRNSDDEPAWFDEIYLARTQNDFKWIDEVSGTKKAVESADPNLLALTLEKHQYGQIMSQVAPQFTTTLVGEPLQLLAEYQNRKQVLRTMPPAKDKPCVLKAPISIRPGKKTVLKISASHHQEADWQLAVRVSGQELLKTIVDKNTAKDGWLDRDVDLSRFAGKNIVVEVLNEATGWNNEHAFWHRLEIVEE